jgi:segregation and condensation protein B
MSLKAKLEAVIYAAEEPVTLAQLAALFADEALALKAGQDAASATEVEQNAPEPAAPDEDLPLLSGELENGATDAAAASSAAAEPAPAAAAAEQGADPAAAQADAKRQARLRDREVRAILRPLLDELIAEYASGARGVEIREIAGGFRMATKPECHDAVRAFVKSLKPPLKLSLPALETLAVIAYKQPVTAPEVNEIRGVDSSAVFGSLLARKLIATAGRKPVIGRPILYKTTREFLLRFGLKDVSELPSMEEFEKLAAAELEEPEIEAEAESAREIRQDLSLELSEPDDGEPEADAVEANLAQEPGEAAETAPAASVAAPGAPPVAK